VGEEKKKKKEPQSFAFWSLRAPLLTHETKGGKREIMRYQGKKKGEGGVVLPVRSPNEEEKNV